MQNATDVFRLGQRPRPVTLCGQIEHFQLVQGVTEPGRYSPFTGAQVLRLAVVKHHWNVVARNDDGAGPLAPELPGAFETAFHANEKLETTALQ